MIRHLLLDLDNTLYPASGGMDEGITRRMIGFVARWLGVPNDQAVECRVEKLPGYGTTLEWLKAEHGLTDETEYFDAVHPESEIEELQRDPLLRDYLLGLGLPLTLLTNAPMSHAKRILRFFNIEDIFLGVFDVTYHKGKGKPHPNSFLDTLSAVGHTVEDTLFVDDHPKYVRGYKAIGGQAVLVDEKDRFGDMERDEGFWRVPSIYGLRDLLMERGILDS